MALFDSFRKDKDFQNAAKARKIQEILENRAKSNSERVLESFQEEDRQEMIKEKVREMNQRRTEEMFMGKFSPGRNIFVGHKNILTSDLNSLKSDMPKSENLFFNSGDMFFGNSGVDNK